LFVSRGSVTVALKPEGMLAGKVLGLSDVAMTPPYFTSFEASLVELLAARLRCGITR
jgi:hypothetical protein